MPRPPVLPKEAVDLVLADHPGWSSDGHKISKTFAFSSYAAALAFVVRVALRAERDDHHPDLALSWGKVRVDFATREPQGLTALDLDGARAAELAYGGAP